MRHTKFNLLRFLLIVFSAPVFAQIPNSGFENWTTKGSGQQSFEDPNGFYTINSMYVQFGFSPAITKTQGRTGNAMTIQSIDDNGNIMTGLVFSGNDMDVIKGTRFPVDKKYTHFEGYYKYQPENGDTCSIGIFLFKGDSIIGVAQFTTSSTVNNFTKFTIAIDYLKNEVPDGAKMMISSSSLEQALGESTLTIDDLDLIEQSTTGISSVAKSNSEILVYPNPANGNSTLNYTINSNENISAELLDISGRSIAILQNTEEKNAGTYSVNIPSESLKAGIYLVKLSGNNTQEIIRFIRQ